MRHLAALVVLLARLARTDGLAQRRPGASW
jgi:hypothetical protein